WYVNQYLKASGAFNWSTRVGSFKFSNCTGAPTPDYSLSASPTSLTIARGNSGGSTITVTSLNGFTSAVGLTVDGCPASTTCGLTRAWVTRPATASTTPPLTVRATAASPTGTVTLTVSADATHKTTVSLTITAPDFSISDSPSSQTITQGSPAS